MANKNIDAEADLWEREFNRTRDSVQREKQRQEATFQALGKELRAHFRQAMKDPEIKNNIARDLYVAKTERRGGGAEMPIPREDIITGYDERRYVDDDEDYNPRSSLPPLKYRG